MKHISLLFCLLFLFGCKNSKTPEVAQLSPEEQRLERVRINREQSDAYRKAVTPIMQEAIQIPEDIRLDGALSGGISIRMLQLGIAYSELYAPPLYSDFHETLGKLINSLSQYVGTLEVLQKAGKTEPSPRVIQSAKEYAEHLDLLLYQLQKIDDGIARAQDGGQGFESNE